MKSRLLNISLTFLMSAGLLVSEAHVGPTKTSGGSRGGKKPSGGLAANCSPSAFSSELDINNTRALIQTGGDMWWDFTRSQYEIPKGSRHTALFAGALWLGGRDISGQLKVAAQRFRSNGVDYWTGPLSVVSAEIDPATCTEFDRHFPTTRTEVTNFVGWYEAGIEDAQNGTNKQAENFPDYTVPNSILDWPAHGRNYEPYNEDYYLAPFVDRDGDGNYNPSAGDYPAYDLNNSSDCKERIVNIFGDQNLWWVFNDKGNVHTETGASSIGMEIRAQAFAFATNDEVNNMTFYNYELVNRSTFELTDTYFGQWVDADLGCSNDDYVGCDVQRGLGYCYNGDNNDEDCNGVFGYGPLPPAIGVDFFQGPFQDADGVDNPLTSKYAEAVEQKGIPYEGIGIGYGDGIIDNERFGMRKFLYHNNARDVRGDPSSGVEYYNYLRSIWRDGSRMVYGGTGHQGDASANPAVPADYMFPGDTDPIGWGTGGRPQEEWTEVTAGNTEGDRRFMQSAGPFTLKPGAVNNITVGVVWARATTGDNLSSVEAMRKADDKTQALFDNCFQILNGPDAPDLTIRELENELILYLENPVLSNNYNEAYEESDPTLIPPDSINSGQGKRPLTPEEIQEYNVYRFQGYMIYQVKDNSVSASDLQDLNKARLIAQVDLRDTVDRLVNYYFDNDLGVDAPRLEVEGENKGIRRSFQITQDAFSDGDNKLVNHRAYYFIAIAYAYNPNSPNLKFLGSRKSATGGINPVKGIPHMTEVQNGGMILNSRYGTGVRLTRVEGLGNGGQSLRLTEKSVNDIMDGFPWKADTLTYERGSGPVDIKVVDPVKVKGGNFTLWFRDSVTNGDLSDAYWMLTGTALKDTFYSPKNISEGTETIIPELGISVNLGQVEDPGSRENRSIDNGFLESEVTFKNPSNAWLSGVSDRDGFSEQNWILSGSQSTVPNNSTPLKEENYDDWNYYYKVGTTVNTRLGAGLDDNQLFEQIEGGVIAPFRLTSYKTSNGPVPGYLRASAVHNALADNPKFKHLFMYDTRGFTSDPNPNATPDSAFRWGIDSANQLNYLHSVNIVITSDRSKWTRCPVFEMRDTISESEGNAIRGQLRDAPSIDKDGNAATTDEGSSDPESANYISGRGMGWFPGYAIDLETGERLNMAYGEDSYLIAENGRDMIWNPTSKIEEDGPFEEFRGGGKHIIYVFRNNRVEDEVLSYDDAPRASADKAPFFNFDMNHPQNRMPGYDAGAWMYEKLKDVRGYLNFGDTTKHNNATHVFRAGMWVVNPVLIPGREDELDKILNEGSNSNDVTVKLRVSTSYKGYGTGRVLEPGESLNIDSSYFVSAGPVFLKEAGRDSVYYPGMSLKPVSNTKYETRYRNGRGSSDISDIIIHNINGGLPTYNFTTTDLAPTVSNIDVAKNALDAIRVVPNPYYSYSKYETDKLDNRVRITNLPRTCTIRIYTINGVLVRTLKKDDDTITSLDWDLKNQQRVPISSGMYIFHVDAPEIGEKILKWMGVMRPVDLDNF
jgi:hypothetical protein